MTYRSYAGAAPDGYGFEAWGAPQSFMMLDIAALQALYGADFSVNAGDTVYRWTPGSGRTLVDGGAAIDPGANRIFTTIWDGDGRDTYDLSAYRGAVAVDLRPGKASVFSEAQLAYLGGGPNGGHARGNVFNALQCDGDRRSLIEDAKGGAGDDRMTGNGASNRLTGQDGDDRLTGLGGRDVLAGGRGDDVFVFGAAAHSRAGAADRLVQGGGAAAFEAGDLIDLRGVDADALRGGDQAFVFGTGQGRGHLWVEERGRASFVCGNIDGDRAAELEVEINDGAARAGDYGAEDFLL
jgi:serralysin